jgi:hypothetical protein
MTVRPCLIRQVPQHGTLLGGCRAFCSSFYHVGRCDEGGWEDACMQAHDDQAGMLRRAAAGGWVPELRTAGLRNPCAHQSIACVGRLTTQAVDAPSGRDAYVARYTNCFRGCMSKNIHRSVRPAGLNL